MFRVRFVERKLMISSSLRCDQSQKCHRYVFGHTLLCYLSWTRMLNKPTSANLFVTLAKCYGHNLQWHHSECRDMCCRLVADIGHHDIQRWVCRISKSNLSSTAKCDQNNGCDNYEFGHT